MPTPTTYTHTLHDALPIYHGRREGRGGRMGEGEQRVSGGCQQQRGEEQQERAAPVGDAADEDATRHDGEREGGEEERGGDRKSTRLNSSHLVISYAVFCLR